MQMVEYLKEAALYIEVTGTQGEAKGPREIRDYNLSSSDYKAKADKLEAKLVPLPSLPFPSPLRSFPSSPHIVPGQD